MWELGFVARISGTLWDASSLGAVQLISTHRERPFTLCSRKILPRILPSIKRVKLGHPLNHACWLPLTLKMQRDTCLTRLTGLFKEKEVYWYVHFNTLTYKILVRNLSVTDVFYHSLPHIFASNVYQMRWVISCLQTRSQTKQQTSTSDKIKSFHS